ncbi:ABC transporter substrate-binding protein [Paenibacillus sp. Leaf72]|uniref:ABC transporter substrate-binding protein n=1 Tax=Paenibacillus sp. Leaf72 TaxID=1736234 RepID=UPI0006F23070|nr:extracellular solute-binding protein [Paenibacillus sp. Leaf72]KQO10859.1 hypothetical protein ASF12_10775 [Paenibacillus sp. Leaf72]
MNKKIKLILVFSAFLLLVGCVSSPRKEEERDYSNQTIRIYTPDTEQIFYRNYGNYILKQFPGLDIQLIQANFQLSGKDRLEEVKRVSPDLSISNYTEYKKMRDESYLIDLNPMIQQAGFDLNKYYKDMVSILSQDGSLYGLSPRVNVLGFYYNKELFDEKGVSYPTSGMDWYEFLQMVGSFTDGISGLETNRAPSSMLMMIAATNKWSFINRENNKIMFNEQDWVQAINSIVSLYKSNSIGKKGGKLFIEGKSALMDSSISFADELISKNNQLSWGFVPSPVNTSEKAESRSVFLDQVFSIPSTSVQKEISLEIVKAIMDEEAADYIDSNQLFPNISTLSNRMKDYHGVDLEAFWQQSIDADPGINFDESNYSWEFVEEFYDILNKSLQMAIDEDLSVEDCFDMIQEKTIEAFEKERLRNE